MGGSGTWCDRQHRAEQQGKRRGERAEEREDRQTKCGVEGGEERARPGPDLELTRPGHEPDVNTSSGGEHVGEQVRPV